MLFWVVHLVGLHTHTVLHDAHRGHCRAIRLTCMCKEPGRHDDLRATMHDERHKLNSRVDSRHEGETAVMINPPEAASTWPA